MRAQRNLSLMRDPELLDVEVDDGTLRVARWAAGRPDAAVVMAVHGITASHVAWAPVAGRLQPDVTVLAPDLRGRGGSNRLGPPYGMAAHARDVLAAASALGVERMVLAGHSMGGFVAATAAAKDPGRISALLLADGGVPTGLAPEGVDPDQAAELLLGPALQRLRMTFESRDSYRDFWRPHPAFAGRWSPAVEAYVDYDIDGEPGAFRSKVSEDAVRADYRDLLTTPEVALERVQCPTLFLYAPRGLQNEPPGLYPPDVVEGMADRFPAVKVEQLPDCNHYTMLLDDSCAALVADRLRGLVSS